jgi:hypothetical protein
MNQRHSPIFIVGCGRSGTTLLRVMLDSHPQIGIPLESLFVIDYLQARTSIPMSVLQELMAQEYEIKEWGLRVCVDDLRDCETPQELVDRVHFLYLQDRGKVRWGQKTPRFVRYGELLKTTYPEAKFVHIVRDPRAVVNSLIRSRSHRSNAYYGALRWIRDVQAGLALKQEYGDDVLAIRYEDLVSVPEETLKRVSAFLGVDYHPAVLSYHEQGTHEYKAYHSVARVEKPPDSDRIEAWRRHLTGAQVALIEAICAETMEELGYVRESDAQRVTALQVALATCQRMVGLFQQLLHYLTYRPGYLFCVAKRRLRLAMAL